MILRAKTKQLFPWELTENQKNNSTLNMKELENKEIILKSLPRRLVLELTNMCNLNCIMCGRNAADFKPTVFKMEWFRYLEQLFDTVEEVTLMGWGEPTVHPNFEEMLSIINKHSAKKYFCTNGMRLDKLKNPIFDNHVDLIGVSVDGAKSQTNDKIRKGSDLNHIISNLQQIQNKKHALGVAYPYINFVFCAMKSNINELPDLVKLAASIGLQEVKVVYLTAFDCKLADETLWDSMDMVREVFNKALELGDKLGVSIKLPHLVGEDPAGNNYHKDCFVGWRDFFLGSDGFVRPCMSTPEQFFKIDVQKDFMEQWNHITMQNHRKIVNNSENMHLACKNCYQSSHCNWNKKESFLQIGNHFSPEWE